MTLSTFCRRCGRHFKIESGKAVLSADQVAALSFNVPVVESTGPIPELKSSQPSDPPPPRSQTAAEIKQRLGQGSRAFTATTNRHKPRKITCFQCHHEHQVTYAAKNAHCPACNAEINLKDYQINRRVREEIETRGTVVINSQGALVCKGIVAHHLRAYGEITGDIHCTGDVILRSVSNISGGIQCDKLILGQGSAIEADGTIEANEMEIHGSITAAEFVCNGAVVIEEGGAINGPLTARSIAMENGGTLNGPMKII